MNKSRVKKIIHMKKTYLCHTAILNLSVVAVDKFLFFHMAVNAWKMSNTQRVEREAGNSATAAENVGYTLTLYVLQTRLLSSKKFWYDMLCFTMMKHYILYSLDEKRPICLFLNLPGNCSLLYPLHMSVNICSPSLNAFVSHEKSNLFSNDV